MSDRPHPPHRGTPTNEKNQALAGNIALVSMPWFWHHMPSIQLAILGDILADLGVRSTAFEFYVDFVDLVGDTLYKTISGSNPYIADALFTRCYFGKDRIPIESLPNFGMRDEAFEKDVFFFAEPLVDGFLEKCYAEADWSQYDAVAFSLTASQTGASMALARLIRVRHPDLPILFGGASCADEMGSALLEICPEVDIVVHKEAEIVLPQLVEALFGDRPLASVPGISWRNAEGLVSNRDAPLYALSRRRGVLNFDAYFERVQRSEVLSQAPLWIPFESSRGCWYGEKAQCTFCGLNEIIKYRERGSGGLLGELEEYERRYGIRRFFALDLIMPLSFFKEFLPQLEAADKGWSIFYEVKSNMRRREIEALARSGVDWIQPGIESLDDAVLKIMRKGVTAAQNVQTLRIARELGIMVGWNIITGFPGEKAESYAKMAALVPLLHHLEAPSGFADFEVHRFSPFFADPEALGIHIRGAHSNYERVFPIDAALLDKLVYRFEYNLTTPADPGLAESYALLRAAVAEWRAANARGADLIITYHVDGSATTADTRATREPAITQLDSHQVALFRFLDEIKVVHRAIEQFEAEDPHSYEVIGGARGAQLLIDAWVKQGLILSLSGYLQALPKVAAVEAVKLPQKEFV